MKEPEAITLLKRCQQHIKDPDLQNDLDRFFDRAPSNKTVLVKLDGKELDLGTCNAFGCDVRIRLAPERCGYSIFREIEEGQDQYIADSMRVFDGESLYAIPPAYR